MKTMTVLCAVAALHCLSTVALSQVTLDDATTDSILKQLTSQPRKAWISTGTIQATHYERRDPQVTDSAVIEERITEAVSEYEAELAKIEKPTESQEKTLEALPFNVKYKLANVYTMTATEVVTYDGERFRWQIDIDSRTDSITPDSTLAANPMADDFQTDANRHRVFTWDGQKYTTTCNSGAQATIDVGDKLPRGVHGPLTAGLIPWGDGKYSYDSLSDAEILAYDSFDGVKTIHLSITHSDGSRTDVNLDPAKNYAVTSATLTATSGFEVTYTLSGYASCDGQWVPSSVVIERKNVGEKNAGPTIERWSDMTVTSTATPSLNDFAVALASNAVVEYLTPTMTASTLYINSGETDMDAMFLQRMAYAADEGKRKQNCATASLEHVASHFGKAVPSSAVAGLVRADGNTNLYDLKRCAQELGLYGHVVKTDLGGLQNLGNAKAILHIPGKGHFVVVDHVDDQYVWLVDLSSKRFYYPQSVASLPLTWTEGTALLLSDHPITGAFAAIPDAASKNIAGGTYYACNTLVQEEDVLSCIDVSGLCQGDYIYFFERWICGLAESGTCPTESLLYRLYTSCILDPLSTCTLYSSWYYRYGTACN